MVIVGILLVVALWWHCDDTVVTVVCHCGVLGVECAVRGTARARRSAQGGECAVG